MITAHHVRISLNMISNDIRTSYKWHQTTALCAAMYARNGQRVLLCSDTTWIPVFSVRVCQICWCRSRLRPARRSWKELVCQHPAKRRMRNPSVCCDWLLLHAGLPTFLGMLFKSISLHYSTIPKDLTVRKDQLKSDKMDWHGGSITIAAKVIHFDHWDGCHPSWDVSDGSWDQVPKKHNLDHCHYRLGKLKWRDTTGLRHWHVVTLV